MPGIAQKRPTPASLFRHILAVVLFIVAAGCSGGGCGSGCSSCGGFTPLAGGFDTTHRIENAGSARVTPSGLTFLEKNVGSLAKGLLGGSAITFEVPMSSTSIGGIVNATICPNGADPTANPKVCTAEIDVANANLTITPGGPSDLHITGTIPLRVQDLQVHFACADLNISINGDGSCPGGNTYDALPVDVDIAIQVDQNMAHTARFGYSQISINNIVDQTPVTNNLDSNLHICGVPSCDTICCIENICTCAVAGIASALESTVVGALYSQIQSTLTTAIDGQLCQKATATTPCPTGTTADGSMVCRYSDNTCASILIGTDGHIDLGGLLQSISPGTKGGLDLLFAAGGPDKNSSDPTMKLSWGDLDPVNGGGTIGLFGGAEPNPISKCVPLSQLTLPTGIPIPDELLGSFDTIPDWPAGQPGPDVEIALNERFANYALGGMYNSGLLCVGISTESIPLLSSGTLGLLAPSSKSLGLQEEPQQVAIVIRPSAPPTVVFGNGTDIMKDPLLRVGLKQVALDFYIFSLDRFIRFMTATFDLDVPVDLDVSAAGLTPVIQQIGVTNGVVTNSQLLTESPTALASSLGDLIGSLVGQQLAGSLKAINLNSALASLGLQLYIPDSVAGAGSPGLRKLTKGTDNYLGIFAGFQLAGTPPGPVIPTGHTSAQVVEKTVFATGLKLLTLRPDNVPVVELVAESNLDDGTRAVEFQYRLDDGFWHPFQASRFITVRDDWLRVQGRHVVHVRSRAVGRPDSLDETDAQVEVVVDAEPPRVVVSPVEQGAVNISARDLVSPDVMVRYRLDAGDWSTWTLASHLGAVVVGDAAAISVEARDNEGNLGTAAQPLVRGRFDGTAAGCGCRTAADDRGPASPALLLVGMALAGLGARARRRSSKKVPSVGPALKAAARRTLGGVAVMAVAATWAGCSCNSNKVNQAGGTGGGTATCGADCTTLFPGLIGEYTSVAVSATDIWVAGYSEADWNNSDQYGNLVVGKYDGTKVDWAQVNGVPATPAVDCTVFNCQGFRGGQSAPGNDVGLWTSIAIGGDGNPAVAYYDRTNQALKFAQYDGMRWTVQTVDSVTSGTAGRYAKMLFLNGNFVIAYQSVAPGGTGGALISKVRIATSAGATPATGSWAFEDAATVMTTPCRASFCASTEACLSTTKVCTATVDGSMCNPSCASGQACIGATAPSCVAIWDSTKIDAYPDAIGDYITVAPDGQGGFGLAYYDRTNGNLVIAAKTAGAWVTTIVDGESATAPGTGGDAGIGATLFIDTNGDWHLAYVNGYSEAIQYVKITKGTTVGTPEVIDDGLSLGGTPFTDGQHLVGDDAHIVVIDGGEVHVTYADSTAGALHYAVGTAATTGHTWQVNAVTQDGFAGEFSSIVVQGGTTQLMSWWRTGASDIEGDVRFVPPP